MPARIQCALAVSKYKLKCIDEINDMLVQSVDEEYHNRAKSKNNPDKNGEHHIRYKVFNATDKIQEKKIKRTWLRFANFRYWFPKKTRNIE